MLLTINGEAVEVEVPPLRRLLDVLRDDLGLTGAKEGCGEGECGACTVLVDGLAVCACLVPVVQCQGVEITTVEGLDDDHPLLGAFERAGAAQCGICTPGMVMAALEVPEGATRDEARRLLAGNLCRCTGYEAILRAVLDAGTE